jgi:hypothetical protein
VVGELLCGDQNRRLRDDLNRHEILHQLAEQDV